MKRIRCIVLVALVGCTPAGVPRDAEYRYDGSSGSAGGRIHPGSGGRSSAGAAINAQPKLK